MLKSTGPTDGWIHRRIDGYIHMHTYAHTYAHTYMQTHTHTCLYTYMYMHICERVKQISSARGIASPPLSTPHGFPSYVDTLEQYGSSTSMAQTSLCESSQGVQSVKKDGLPEARKALKVALIQCRDGMPTAAVLTSWQTPPQRFRLSRRCTLTSAP